MTLDFGFWNSGQGFRIAQSPKSLDFGLWALDLKLWVMDFAFSVLGFGLWALGLGFKILDSRYCNLEFGLWALDLRVWTLDFWSLDSTFGSTLDSGLQGLDLGF